jgi:hypothetical protein
MKIVHVYFKPEVSPFTKQDVKSKYVLPTLDILDSTSPEEIRAYQSKILYILTDYKQNLPHHEKDEKKTNKMIQKIVSLLTKLIKAVEGKNRPQIIDIAAQLHDLVQTFNITGTFDFQITSVSGVENEVELRNFLISQILEKLR